MKSTRNMQVSELGRRCTNKASAGYSIFCGKIFRERGKFYELLHGITASIWYKHHYPLSMIYIPLELLGKVQCGIVKASCVEIRSITEGPILSALEWRVWPPATTTMRLLMNMVGSQLQRCYFLAHTLLLVLSIEVILSNLFWMLQKVWYQVRILMNYYMVWELQKYSRISSPLW